MVRWPSSPSSTSRPRVRASLEGHLFSFNNAPNRYGLGPFYELHVWAWKGNPKGTFADMNMDVSCDAMPRSRRGQRHRERTDKMKTLRHRTRDPRHRRQDRWRVPRHLRNLQPCPLAARTHVQWEHSYVAGDKTFCIYLADDEAAIRRHAELSGFPATVITEIATILDPTTAN